MVASAASKTFMQRWFRLEVAPIVAIMAFAVGGAGWYVTRLARRPDVVWDRKNNKYPWLHVDQDTNIKMHAVSHNFEKSYTRDRL